VIKLPLLVKLYYHSQVLIVILGFTAVFRQLSLFNATKMLLSMSWGFDLLFVGLALVSIKSFRLPKWVFPPAMLLLTAPLLGAYNGFLNHTLVTDIVVYSTFFLKISIFFKLFKQHLYRQQFNSFLLMYCKAAVITGVLTVATLTLLKSLGYQFYFSATPDITYSYALNLTSGNVWYSYFIFGLSIMTGKKMLVIGFFVIYILAYKRYFNHYKHNLLLLLGCIIAVIYIGPSVIDSTPGLAKFQKLTQLQGDNLYTILMKLDRHRFSEILGIIDVMEWYDYILGKGYGFRFYWFDNDILKDAGITNSNAHFSPMGIISRFGIIGFILFSILFIYVLWCAFKSRKKTHLAYANYLFLASILVQSLFAYILFNNTLVPLVIALVLNSRAEHENLRHI